MQIPYEVQARPDTGLYKAKLGIWLFLASEVMVFGGLFFSMALIGDRQYAAANYQYYRNYADSFPNEVAAGQIVVAPFEERQRAFAGIESRLWGTVDDDLPPEGAPGAL